MKILVFAHQLEVGGTQVNAIELSAALRDLHGHEVVLFAAPGPMADLVRARRLRFVPAPEARVYPSRARMRALRQIVRQERFDVVHAWDWWQGLDAFYGVHVPWRVPVVVSDMCMSFNRILPRSLPTTFGTPAMVDTARSFGHRHAELLLPPIDVRSNAPGAVDGRAFRREQQITDDEILVVCVSRFDESFKAESLRRTVAAVRSIGRDLPVRLALVGDGPLRMELQCLADASNTELGRRAVVLTGALLDPRPAYAAADLVIGMGGSALRAMAFAKPVVIVGEGGFSAPFTPETAAMFYHQGIYGTDAGTAGDTRLAAQVRSLLRHPDIQAIGDFSRAFVVRHFALEAASQRLSTLCERAAGEKTMPLAPVLDGLRSAAIWIRERRFIAAQKAFIPSSVEREAAGVPGL